MRPANPIFGFLYDGLVLVGWFLGSIRQSFRGRHVKWLESEVIRLNAENRALWQSIWNQQGRGKPDLPPIGIPTAMTGHPESRTNEPSEPSAHETRGQHRSMGRRSWPQMRANFEKTAREALVKEAQEQVAAAMARRPPTATNGAGQGEPQVKGVPDAT